jgi:hypothetical protein
VKIDKFHKKLCEKREALVMLTKWKEFRILDMKRDLHRMKPIRQEEGYLWAILTRR